MDDRSIGGKELTRALSQLRWINRVLGAGRPTLEGIDRLWNRAGRPRSLSLLDVGSGSGDLGRPILRWAGRRHLEVRITLMDIHPETCTAAAAHYAGEPRVRVEEGDLFRLARRRDDIVTASLLLHHIATPRLPDALLSMLRASRLGVVVNDLHRHWLAWAAIWAGTRLLSRNRMIRHDAPLSVRRAFRGPELAGLRLRPGLSQLEYAWRPLFRYLIVVPRHGAVG